MVESLVEYLYEPGGTKPYKCGYCKSQDTSYTQGIWSFNMTCQDYQSLVDRGFQRSGNFVYRPVMKSTCCPQYVVRMDVTKFKLSKSQRASIKKFKHYLVNGKSSTEAAASIDVMASTPTDSGTPVCSNASVDSVLGSTSGEITGDLQMKKELPSPAMCKKSKKAVKPGLGPDPNKPPCKKAKVIRQERKEQKRLAKLAIQKPPNSEIRQEHTDTEVKSEEKFRENLQNILTFPKDEECVHKFKTRLVPIIRTNRVYADTYMESYEVFKKFQINIHKETEEDSGESQFNEFLVNSPLMYEEGPENMVTGYGTYHQQYILDDKIFAVGVLDILPKGVLCEYLYYDPNYRFIAPGVITALMEILMTQQFYTQIPKMQYYYMGFYVQSCPKMNYKSRYSASSLLCPETHTYVPLEECIPKMKASPYSRLATPDVENMQENCTEEELSTIPVYSESAVMMTYGTYKLLNGDQLNMVVKEYVDLVGLKVASNMRLYLRKDIPDHDYS